MVINTLENGRMVREMDKEKCIILILVNILGSGRMIREMDKDKYII